MIEAVDITNFQAHSSTFIEFEMVTTITGVTDAGKSAVMRAIKWPGLNVPKGHDFIKTGEAVAQVTLCVDGQEVTRERSKSKNKYYLDGDEFVSFGDKVPEPIAELLALDPVNFQDQHDAPYWFCLSAGDVSKQLNSIVNLQAIDTSHSALNTGKNSALGRKTVVQERITELETELEGLRYVKKLKKVVGKMADLEARRDELRGSVALLGDRARAAEAQHDFVTRSVAALRASQKPLLLGHEYFTIEAEAVRVLRLIRTAEAHKASMHEGLELSAPTELLKIEAKVMRLRALVREADDADDCVVVRQAELDLATKALNLAKKRGCPICGK